MQFEFWPGVLQYGPPPRSAPPRPVRARRRLAGREQLAAARLEGVTLTARELAHRLNNALQPAVILCQLLSSDAELAPAVRTLLADAESSLLQAASDLVSLQRVTHVATRATPVGLALDLDRAVLPLAAHRRS